MDSQAILRGLCPPHPHASPLQSDRTRMQIRTNYGPLQKTLWLFVTVSVFWRLLTVPLLHITIFTLVSYYFSMQVICHDYWILSNGRWI